MVETGDRVVVTCFFSHLVSPRGLFLQVREDLSAEWHTKCRVACEAQERHDQEVQFSGSSRSGTGTRSGFWCMGYLFKGSFIFAEETLQKWFLVFDYLGALKDYLFPVSGFQAHTDEGYGLPKLVARRDY